MLEIKIAVGLVSFECLLSHTPTPTMCVSSTINKNSGSGIRSQPEDLKSKTNRP